MNNKKAFTIIEMIISIGILTGLMAAVTPLVVTQINIAHAKHDAREVLLVEQAARNFYKDNYSWPASIQELKDGEYLNPDWHGNDSWGEAIQVESSEHMFKVTLNGIPQKYHGGAMMMLPHCNQNASYVASDGESYTAEYYSSIEHEAEHYVGADGASYTPEYYSSIEYAEEHYCSTLDESETPQSFPEDSHYFVEDNFYTTEYIDGILYFIGHWAGVPGYPIGPPPPYPGVVWWVNFYNSIEHYDEGHIGPDGESYTPEYYSSLTYQDEGYIGSDGISYGVDYYNSMEYTADSITSTVPPPAEALAFQTCLHKSSVDPEYRTMHETLKVPKVQGPTGKPYYVNYETGLAYAEDVWVEAWGKYASEFKPKINRTRRVVEYQEVFDMPYGTPAPAHQPGQVWEHWTYWHTVQTWYKPPGFQDHGITQVMKVGLGTVAGNRDMATEGHGIQLHTECLEGGHIPMQYLLVRRAQECFRTAATAQALLTRLMIFLVIGLAQLVWMYGGGGLNNKKGFTLLELLIVMGISTILMASVTPVFVKQVRIKSARNCAAEIKLIQDCALKYYVDNKEWPATAADMQNEGLLNPNWHGKNVFGNDYAFSNNETTFTVTVDVPQDVQGLVLARASETDSTGDSVSSTVSAPGLMDTDRLIHLYAEADELRTMDQEVFVSKIELPGSDYNSDFQTGEGRLKDVYVAKLGMWLSEIRPEVSEVEEVVVETVHHHYATPFPPVTMTCPVEVEVGCCVEVFDTWYRVNGGAAQNKDWQAQVQLHAVLPSTGPHGHPVSYQTGGAWTDTGSGPHGQGQDGNGWRGIWNVWDMGCWMGHQCRSKVWGIETWQEQVYP